MLSVLLIRLVTSLQEAATNTIMLHALKELDGENALKVDVAAHIVYAPEYVALESLESLNELLDNAKEYGSKYIDTRFMKVILDGVPLPPLSTHAGLTADGEVDASKFTINDISKVIGEYDRKGFKCKFHCTGHGSTRATLDPIEMARKANPNGPRHEIAHCSGVHPDDYSRFSSVNTTAEMSPAMFFTHPARAASHRAMDWDFTKMLDNDAHSTIGSDWGGTFEPDLLPHCAGVVEKVGAERLCRILTLAGAEAVGREREVGSIEVGKKANFIAVSRDLSKGEFEGAEVLRTWFEGEVAYEKSPKS